MKNKKRWEDLSDPQRIAVVGLGILQVGLLAAALVDIHRRAADKINGSKTTWTIVSFFNFVGPIAYFTFGRKN